MMMPEALGKHLLVEFAGCPSDILNDVTRLETSMVEAARGAGATVINTAFHHFSPYGVSGVVVIQESHLSIHTWPEYGFAAIDIFTCGQTLDPWTAYASLKTSLRAAQGSTHEVLRGQREAGLTPSPQLVTSHANQAPSPRPYSRNIWFTDRSENIALSLRHGGVLFQKQSNHQRVEILDTYGYGKMLVIDGNVMCTEKDEFVYHEMLVHVPVLTHPDPRHVLIIGGGDGGALRELTRHDGLASLTLVEIDETVIEAARHCLPEMATGFEDPRLNLHIQDGVTYVQTAPEHTFDIVLIDAAGPEGPAEGLFTEGFYAGIHRCLKPDGLMVTQSAPPTLFNPRFTKTFHTQQRVFGPGHVHCYLAFLPTYTTGMVSFFYAAKTAGSPLHALDQPGANAFATAAGLRYYTGDIHRAAFTLPTFVRQMLQDIP